MRIAFLIPIIFALAIGLTHADPTYRGQPIGPALSPADANDFIDDQIQDYWTVHGADASFGMIQPDDINHLAQTVEPLGGANLLASFDHLPIDADMPTWGVNQDEIKYRVLLVALSKVTTDADLDTLIAEYAHRSRIISLFVDHKEWDANSKVTDFVMANLDQMPDTYRRSSRTAHQLLILAARSTDPDVQSKLETFVADAVANDGNYNNAHLYGDLLDLALTYPQSTLAKHFADILTVADRRAKSDPSDLTLDISPESIFTSGLFANQVMAQPTLVADPRIKPALLDLLQKSTIPIANILIPVAASGDNSALVKIGTIYSNPDSVFTDYPVHDSAAGEKSRAEKYLRTVLRPGANPKATNLADHLDTATYDPKTCLWTVPAPTSPNP